MCEGQLINYFYQKHFEITVIKNSFPIIYPLPRAPIRDSIHGECGEKCEAKVVDYRLKE